MNSPMTPTEQDKKLEVALMELFCRSEEFGRVFLTRVSKEEFAKSVNDGALDHQQAAHEAMQLITTDRKRVALEARIDELTNFMSTLVTTHGDIPARSVSTAKIRQRIAELKAKQEKL